MRYRLWVACFQRRFVQVLQMTYASFKSVQCQDWKLLESFKIPKKTRLLIVIEKSDLPEYCKKEELRFNYIIFEMPSVFTKNNRIYIVIFKDPPFFYILSKISLN